jgi:large subunit ribosomal protein L10
VFDEVFKMLKRDKPEELKKVKELIQKYKIIGILNMHKLPTKQAQQIKKSLEGKAVFRMSKKNILIGALQEAGKPNLAQLAEKIKHEPALILTNENPFKIFSMIKKSRMPASAKIGDIAPKDIIIPKGPTTLSPGPAITTLQKVGLKTSVQGGKIAVLMDKVACKADETITADMVSVFSLLKIEPMEIGIDIVAAYEDGIVYDKEVLDVEQYVKEIMDCVHKAVNMSVNIGYPTKLTIELMLQKAFNEAKSLCVNANVIEKDFIDDVLRKSALEAKNLEAKLNIS